MIYRTKFILLILLLSSCASNKSRRPILQTTLSLSGGKYQDQAWNDNLTLYRTSWFKDATLTQDILIADLKTQSPFANWMGKDKLLLQKCQQFFVTLIYSDISAKQKLGYLRTQLESNGLKEYSILDFSFEIMAHQQIIDWNLQQHKVIGWCSEDTNTNKSIDITLPGYMKKNLSY